MATNVILADINEKHTAKNWAKYDLVEMFCNTLFSNILITGVTVSFWHSRCVSCE